MSVTLESMSADNLAVLVWGAKNDIAAVTTQTHEFPDGIVAGQTHIVPNGFNMTNTFAQGLAGSPVTVPTTKYDLDASFGTIQFLDVATYTQPFDASLRSRRRCRYSVYDATGSDALPALRGS
jgi:hypothetical protein